MAREVLIIGGGIAGVQAALDLAEAGAKAIIVENTPAIGGIMAALIRISPLLIVQSVLKVPSYQKLILTLI